MNVLIYFGLIACFTALNGIESKSISLSTDIHSRTKRGHLGTLSSPKNDDERQAIQKVINMWNSWGALGKRPGKIFHTVVGRSRARLDLQGTYNSGKYGFERFAVQIDSRTFSVVHLQKGVQFGVGLIRSAFEESRDHLSHVFLTDTKATVNLPNDGNRYENKKIQRLWNRKWNTVRVWGVSQSIGHMERKFNKKG